MNESPRLGRPVRTAIVGLGRIYDLTILGYRDNPDAEVVALCDPDADRLARRASDWPDATPFAQLDEMLGRTDIDLVEVLVPSPLHCEVVCAALDAGHHVNVQKPMATTVEEADGMIAARDRSGRVLRVMENFIHYAPLRELKRVVESGEIGEPAGLHMKMVATGQGGWDVPWQTWEWYFEMARRGRGILVYDDGWHKFSVARWLFGPVREVMGWVGQTEVGPGIVIDAPSTIMWTHTNGLRGVFDITFAPDMLMRSDYYTNDERFEVTGRKGFVRVNRCTSRGLQMPSVEVYADGQMRTYHALDDDWASSFRTQTTEFLPWLVTGDGELLWDADTARDVLAFQLAAIESSDQNAPVQLS